MALRQWRSRLDAETRKWSEWYDSLGTRSKVFILGYAAVNVVVLAAFLVVGPSEIFHQLRLFALAIRSHPLAPLLILAGFVLTGFPPLVGYSTLVTLCGFAYGAIWGWLLATAGCLLASSVAFLVLRRVGKKMFEDWLAGQAHFRALSRAMERKGLGLLVLVRLCPFPFAYSNLFFASLPPATATLPKFLLATLCISPKLLLHTFIGSRVFALSDDDPPVDDPWAKIVNVVYIIGGVAVGIGTGTHVYRLTMDEVKTVEEEEQGGIYDDEDEEQGGGRRDGARASLIIPE